MGGSQYLEFGAMGSTGLLARANTLTDVANTTARRATVVVYFQGGQHPSCALTRAHKPKSGAGVSDVTHLSPNLAEAGDASQTWRFSHVTHRPLGRLFVLAL